MGCGWVSVIAGFGVRLRSWSDTGEREKFIRQGEFTLHNAGLPDAHLADDPVLGANVRGEQMSAGVGAGQPVARVSVDVPLRRRLSRRQDATCLAGGPRPAGAGVPPRRPSGGRLPACVARGPSVTDSPCRAPMCARPRLGLARWRCAMQLRGLTELHRPSALRLRPSVCNEQRAFLHRQPLRSRHTA